MGGVGWGVRWELKCNADGCGVGFLGKMCRISFPTEGSVPGG